MRSLGLALFLPVPLVLWLFTAQPLGALPSLGLGAALMLTHRLYARPWALARAGRRCLWCGSTGREVALDLEEPRGSTRWAACSEAHANRARAFLGWASARAIVLKAGILGSLALLVGVSLIAFLTPESSFVPADAPAVFRLGVALTVLPLGWFGPRSRQQPGRLPFPVHIQALIGTCAVSWLFRVVGLVWLGLALRHVAQRL